MYIHSNHICKRAFAEWWSWIMFNPICLVIALFEPYQSVPMDRLDCSNSIGKMPTT